MTYLFRTCVIIALRNFALSVRSIITTQIHKRDYFEKKVMQKRCCYSEIRLQTLCFSNRRRLDQTTKVWSIGDSKPLFIHRICRDWPKKTGFQIVPFDLGGESGKNTYLKSLLSQEKAKKYLNINVFLVRSTSVIGNVSLVDVDSWHEVTSFIPSILITMRVVCFDYHVFNKRHNVNILSKASNKNVSNNW